jgi:hypothetical protein
MLLGGLVAGGGVGLLTALLRQRNAIVEDKNEAADSDLELQLPARLRKQASGFSQLMNLAAPAGEWFNEKMAPAEQYVQSPMPAAGKQPLSVWDYMLGGAAFPLAALGGLQLTRKAYQGWRERDVKDRLAEQQSRYMAALQAEAEGTKEAADGRGLSMPQIAALAIGGIPLLTALTSGLLTDRFLDQQFPLKPKMQAPVNRVRVGFGEDPAAEEEEDTEAFKKASDALVHVALQFEKLAADAGVKAVIAAVGHGMLDDLERHQFKYGSDAMLDLAQGANLELPSDPLVKCAAVRVAVQSGIGPALMLMSAGVFANAAPHWRKQGAQLAEFNKTASQLISCTASALDLHIAALAGEEVIKAAAAQAAPQTPMEQLRAMLAQQGGAATIGKDDASQMHTGTLQTAATGSQFSDSTQQVNRPQNIKDDIVDNVLVK